MPAQSITVTLHFYPLKNPSPTMQFTLVLCEFTGFQFVLPATHSCTFLYILSRYWMCNVQLQKLLEVRTGMNLRKMILHGSGIRRLNIEITTHTPVNLDTLRIWKLFYFGNKTALIAGKLIYYLLKSFRLFSWFWAQSQLPIGIF